MLDLHRLLRSLSPVVWGAFAVASACSAGSGAGGQVSGAPAPNAESAALTPSGAPPPQLADIRPVVLATAGQRDAPPLPADLQPRAVWGGGVLATSTEQGRVFWLEASSPRGPFTSGASVELASVPAYAKLVDAAFDADPNTAIVGLASYGVFRVAKSGGEPTPLQGLASPSVAMVERVDPAASGGAELVVGYTPIGPIERPGGLQWLGPRGTSPLSVPSVEAPDVSRASRVVDVVASEGRLVAATSLGVFVIDPASGGWTLVARGLATDLVGQGGGEVLAFGEEVWSVRGESAARLPVKGPLAARLRGGVVAACAGTDGALRMVLNRGAVVWAAVRDGELWPTAIAEPGEAPSGAASLVCLPGGGALLGTRAAGMFALP